MPPDLDDYNGEERRNPARRNYDRELIRKVERLSQTIYGLEQEEGSGLVRAVRGLETQVARLNSRLSAAAISFALLALGVAVDILAR